MSMKRRLLYSVVAVFYVPLWCVGAISGFIFCGVKLGFNSALELIEDMHRRIEKDVRV